MLGVYFISVSHRICKSDSESPQVYQCTGNCYSRSQRRLGETLSGTEPGGCRFSCPTTSPRRGLLAKKLVQIASKYFKADKNQRHSRWPLSSSPSNCFKQFRNGQESQRGDLKSLASKEQIKYAGGTNSEQDWDILRRAAFFGGAHTIPARESCRPFTRVPVIRARDHSLGTNMHLKMHL